MLTTNSLPASGMSAAPAIGCAQNFVHMVKMYPYCWTSAAETAELDRLLKACILERIDASPWVSPIVVTGWKTGGILVRTDLLETNKAVITDCYPLPHMDELDSVGFSKALHLHLQLFRKYWLTFSKASLLSKIIWMTSLSTTAPLLNMTRTMEAHSTSVMIKILT